MSDPTPANAIPTSAPVRHPFGLPPGTVRGILSVLICSFFWVVLLLPPSYTEARVALAHFFLLGLVLMAFASHPNSEEKSEPLLPWLMRVVFIGGSLATVAIAWVKDASLLQHRLTPDIEEIRNWWIPFMSTMAGGFAFGLFLRFILGRTNQIFMTLRAWFSVVGSVMLAIEIAIFLSTLSGDSAAAKDFLHYWQCVGIVIVSAYFGTRA